jgi:5-formyltetrahydrofolate cyclo-ligase
LDTNQQKEELRNKLLEQRAALSTPEYFGASADIIEKLKEQDQFREAQTIHCYVSMNSRREVETQELIIEMLSKNKRMVVPITNFDSGTLTHIELDKFEDLETNKWGVLEPREGERVPVHEIDIVIVPMVGGDEQCNRIGYGKGFYDRFLTDVDCPKIGLIFEQNIVPQIPTEEFDIALDSIITEERIIYGN